MSIIHRNNCFNLDVELLGMECLAADDSNLYARNHVYICMMLFMISSVFFGSSHVHSSFDGFEGDYGYLTKVELVKSDFIYSCAGET